MKIQLSYGVCYLEQTKPRIMLKKFYSVRKTRRGSWMIYETFTDEIIMIVPTKLRAYYVAAKYNGVDVSNFFKFGDIL